MFQSPNISESKTKSHNPNMNSTQISPTRITAQRKSKPDMNTLTMAICCNKRRIVHVSPVKSMDLKILTVEDDRKYADKENEYINGTSVLTVNLSSW